ncbi:MAG: hypothetical protein AAF223_16245 [Bacteroidota bacterium]
MTEKCNTRRKEQGASQYADLADPLLTNMDAVAWCIELMIPKAIAHRAIVDVTRVRAFLPFPKWDNKGT